MADSSGQSVPRTPESPSAGEVLMAMENCEPYTASELADEFEDVSSRTIQRRLESLRASGLVHKKKHHERRVSWWTEPVD